MQKTIKRRKGNHSAKVIFLGNSGVGKTHFIYSLCDYHNYGRLTTTVGVDVRKCLVDVESDSIQLCFWDTAGQQRFRTITSSYFHNVDAVVYVYSLTDRSSFTQIKKWFHQSVTDQCQNSVKVIIGNKVDMQEKREVSEEQGLQLIRELQQKYKTPIYFQEGSALTQANVGKVLDYLSKQILKRKVKQNPLGRRQILLTEESEYGKQRKRCC